MKLATSEILATIRNQNKPHNRIEIAATLECLEGIAQWVLRADEEDAGTGAWNTLSECLQSALNSWGIGDWDIALTDAGEAALGAAYTTDEAARI